MPKRHQKFSEEYGKIQDILHGVYLKGFEEGAAYAEQRYKEGYEAGKQSASVNKTLPSDQTNKLYVYVKRILSIGRKDAIPFWVLKELFPKIECVFDVLREYSVDVIIVTINKYDEPLKENDIVRSTTTDLFHRVYSIKDKHCRVLNTDGEAETLPLNTLIKAGRRSLDAN